MQKNIRVITLGLITLMFFPSLLAVKKDSTNKNALCDIESSEHVEVRENVKSPEKLVKSTMEHDQSGVENQPQEKTTKSSALHDCPVETDAHELMVLEKSNQIAEEDITDLVSSMVVLVDVDVKRKMIVLDVDFHREDPLKMDSLLIRYANNPEQAEAMLEAVAQRYVTEHGDDLLCAVLRNCNVADAEMVTHMLRPVLQKALLNEFLKAMHCCIVFKSHRLSEVIDH